MVTLLAPNPGPPPGSVEARLRWLPHDPVCVPKPTTGHRNFGAVPAERRFARDLIRC